MAFRFFPGFRREGGLRLEVDSQCGSHALFSLGNVTLLYSPLLLAVCLSFCCMRSTRKCFFLVFRLRELFPLGSTVDTRSCVSLWSFWTTVARTPCLRQSLVWCLLCPRSSGNFDWCIIAYSACLLDSGYTCAAVNGVFAEFHAYSM